MAVGWDGMRWFNLAVALRGWMVAGRMGEENWSTTDHGLDGDG